MQAADAQDEIYAIVRRAWVETLPHCPFDPEQSWEDAGADSLKSLHLVMRLERALGRKVSFDLITREMTAGELAQRLESGRQASRAVEAGAARQIVYFVPGLYGYDTTQGNFRRALEGEISLEVVDLPDLEVPTDVHLDMVATAQVIAEAIINEAPEGDVYLAGYSYGGAVAYEAAQLLAKCGRNVAFLAILDTILDPSIDDFTLEEELDAVGSDVMAGGSPVLRRMLPKRGEGPVAFYDRLSFAALMKLGLVETARRTVLRTRHRVAPDVLVNRRKFVLGVCRRHAIQNWRPQPSDIPAFVVCSDEGVRHKLAQRWRRLSPSAGTLHVPGGHMEMFKDRSLALLAPAFRTAVMRARSAEH